MNTLLIVDDERGFAEFVAQVATTAGYLPCITDTPQTFLDALDNQPSVVMLDLQMPDMDGIALLRELATRHCTATVLVASGIDVRTLETVRRLGAELHLEMGPGISKPVRAAELRAQLVALRRYAWEPTVETLERAIAGDELVALYQPKIELSSGRCVGAEMLIRWRDPGGALMAPDQFVPFAEQTGLIDLLTDWVLRNGIAQAGHWYRSGLDMKLSVNASAANMHDLTLPDRVEKLCRDAGLPPSRLVVELTETATMRDAARLMEVLARLRLKGVELSIDDFGTGYSSLVQLHRLPFTEVKIDKSFVTTITSETTAIAHAITQLGHALGLTVTAEGVETQPALEQMIRLGVDLAQGYLMSRPIPAADIPEFYRSRMVAA